LNNEDNILQRIRDFLGNSAENFSILEHQVDVKVQMDYFEFSRNHPPSDDVSLVLSQEPELYLQEAELDHKKAILVSLASIEKPEAYRVLERFVSNAPAELKDWATMAFQESRMLLETRLLDEQQVFISTGLGGKGSKLRYFVVLFSQSEDEFTQTQMKVMRSEFEFILRRFHSEIEDIRFFSKYATIVALVPLNVPVKQPFQLSIEECNSLGPFIQQGFIITNVKILSESEIEEVLKNPPQEIEIE
jgi:hypothetical protein